MKIRKKQYFELLYFNILILAGFCSSLFLVRYIDSSDQSNLIHYMSVLIDIQDYKEYFVSQFMIGIITTLLIIFISTSYIGAPFIAFLIYTKGLQIGLSCTLFIATYSFKGILGIAIVFVPQIIFDLISFCIVSMYSIKHTKNVYYCISNTATVNRKTLLNRMLNILIVSILLIFISSYIKSSIAIDCIRFFENL